MRATLPKDDSPKAKPMADDPLSSFRQRFSPRPPAAQPAPAPALVVNRHPDRESYEAFAAKDKVNRLDIRCGRGLAHAVSYNYLHNISYNRKTYSEIFLTVSGLTVMIKGRGLRPVVDALKQHTCDFIQEYDAEEFTNPVDVNAPFIESITVEVLRGVAPSTSSSEAR